MNTDDLSSLSEPGELGELRGRLRGQWKAERRAEEREALREHWAQRDLVGAVADAMHRGDHLTITVPGGRKLAGHVVAVGRDYAVLHSHQPASREFAVRLPAADPHGDADPYRGPAVLIEVTSAEKPINLALPSREAPATFQAVLHQYAFEQRQQLTRQIELGTTFHPHGLLGRLQAHAGDHVLVHDPCSGHHLVVAAAAVTYIAWLDKDSTL